MPIIASVPRVQRLILSSGVHTLSMGADLQGLSPSSSAIHGDAVLVEPTIALQTGTRTDLLADRRACQRDKPTPRGRRLRRVA